MFQLKSKSRLNLLLSGASAIALTLGGCSKSGANVAAGLDPSKVPAVVAGAFESSSGETKQQAASYVEAFQGQDATVSFLQLQKLKAQNDLTPSQRAVLAKAMQTTLKQLQAAAQKGDAGAQSVLHQYLSSR